MKKRSFGREIQKKRGLWLLAAPGIVLLFLFNFLPLGWIVIAFKNIDYSKGIWKSPWAGRFGLDNFKFFFSSNDAWKVTRNTIVLNLLFITATLVVSVTFALLLYEVSNRAVKTYQTVLFLPYLISWIVISYALESFIDYRYGLINQLAQAAGAAKVNYYMEAKYWYFILVFAYIWKYAGYYSILYYTRLLSIDSSYFEAADIDGATKLQKIWYISLANLRPLIVMMCLIQIGNIFYSDFGMYYFLTKDNGMLYRVTDVIDTYTYRALKKINDPGMGAAVGLYQSLVGFVMVLLFNKLAQKIDSESALF